MKKARMSQVQKEVLRCLAKAFIKGGHQPGRQSSAWERYSPEQLLSFM
uniref:Uncharacterized protein n=1 Tax=Vibrio splendidus TaxID=29497 RepID=A0A0H3ZV43_VIBSP|nr:hypothetical protein [Vibrio splendidus]